MRTVGGVEPDSGEKGSSRKGHRTDETRQAGVTCARDTSTKVPALPLSSNSEEQSHGEQMHRYELRNAINGQLCVGTWSLSVGSRHRSQTRRSTVNSMLRIRSFRHATSIRAGEHRWTGYDWALLSEAFTHKRTSPQRQSITYPKSCRCLLIHNNIFRRHYSPSE